MLGHLRIFLELIATFIFSSRLCSLPVCAPLPQEVAGAGRGSSQVSKEVALHGADRVRAGRLHGAGRDRAGRLHGADWDSRATRVELAAGEASRGGAGPASMGPRDELHGAVRGKAGRVPGEANTEARVREATGAVPGAASRGGADVARRMTVSLAPHSSTPQRATATRPRYLGHSPDTSATGALGHNSTLQVHITKS